MLAGKLTSVWASWRDRTASISVRPCDQLRGSRVPDFTSGSTDVALQDYTKYVVAPILFP